MASGWESADLLTRWNRAVGRPDTDALKDVTKYQYLADAQDAIITRIASISAKVLYGAPKPLITTDGGYTYTFGVDGNGYPLFPMGPAKIFNSLTAIPDYPLIPGVDYLDEGTTIRGPNNLPIPGPGPLYWYGLTPPARMSATVQPILQPPPFRICIMLKAASDWAQTQGVLNANTVDRYEGQYEREFARNMTQVRKHFQAGGAIGRLLLPYGAAGFPSSGMVGLGSN